MRNNCYLLAGAGNPGSMYWISLQSFYSSRGNFILTNVEHKISTHINFNFDSVQHKTNEKHSRAQNKKNERKN